MKIARRDFLAAASILCLPKRLRAATLLRRPYLQNVQANQASVLWTTDTPGNGTVTATSPRHGSVTASATMQAFQPSETGLASAFYQFRADLAGLAPATAYTYSVTMDGHPLATNPQEFVLQTAPPEGFSFLVLGDSGACSNEQEALVGLMAAEPGISMVVHVGDLAYPDGAFAEFESGYYGMNEPLMSRLPFFSIPGNHEYNTANAAPYLAGIATPACGVPAADEGRYYSFDWGCAHFAAVDSNLLATASAGRMLAWLDADLSATRQPWRIVFLHHTPYPTGFHLGDPVCIAVQKLVTPIVERHGVQMVLAGHEHAYERTHPLAGGQPAAPGAPSTLYVVSGGGGGALESVGASPLCALALDVFHYLRIDVAETLTISAVGLDGKTFDRVTLGPVQGLVIESVRNRGDHSRALAPGSLVSISGRNLAGRVERTFSNPPSTVLGGASVKAGSLAAPLLYVSGTQIEAQIPYEADGPIDLEIATPNGLAYHNVTISRTAPSLLAIRAGEAPFSGFNPARPGGRVTLYLTGLGAVQPAGWRSVPVARIEVWLGHLRIAPLSAQLAEDLPGIYRVDFEVPPDVEDGLYAVSVAADGVPSRATNLDVRRAGIAFRRDRACERVHMRPRY